MGMRRNVGFLAVPLILLAALALHEHNRAKFWECNAARREVVGQFWQSLVEFGKPSLSEPEQSGRYDFWFPPGPDRPDVRVRLRHPEPYQGCWDPGEWSATLGASSRTATR
jgi:hypothetical protein